MYDIIIALVKGNELKRCPFCANEKPELKLGEIKVDGLDSLLVTRRATIVCPECGCSSHSVYLPIRFDDSRKQILVDEFDYLKNLKRAWNTRGGVSDGPD